MPKDYSRGKIYKIVCNITNKIYIGSTCEPTLARRLAWHVQDFKKWKNGKKVIV
jgi:predicted GIY-YIG superfamily endonuclease